MLSFKFSNLDSPSRRGGQVSSFKNSGFTFLELIIVFFVVIVGVLGVFQFASYPIFYSSLSESRLTATYLAQEGIEIVRNLRDENWLNDESWNNGLETGDYIVDYGSALLLFEDKFLNIEDINGLYGYNDSGSPIQTKFKRKITIVYGMEILKVSVKVEWKEKGKEQTPVVIQENLYSWW